MIYASLQERILANSVPSIDNAYEGTACWEWLGRRSGGRGASYPVMSIRFKSGPRKGKPYPVRVHRLVVRLFNGRRLTPRMVVLHLCNNPNCVNPEHLLGGSQSANVRQCVADGRHFTPFRKVAAVSDAVKGGSINPEHLTEYIGLLEEFHIDSPAALRAELERLATMAAETL